jgi:hypothetical protein
MTLIKPRKRINAKEVAELLGCSPKTVLNGGAGTSNLTRIRNARNQVRFLLQEVLELMHFQEQTAGLSLPSRAQYKARGHSHSPTL